MQFVLAMIELKNCLLGIKQQSLEPGIMKEFNLFLGEHFSYADAS